MTDTELEQMIVAFVRRPEYRPLKPRAIAHRLQMSQSEVPDVKKAVKRLVGRGELAYGSSHLVQSADAVKPKSNRLIGVFRRAEGGYGFVRIKNKAPESGPVPDIYIPSTKTLDASNGDVVAVRLLKPKADGEARTRGEIVEIIERDTHRFVGTYFESRGEALVQVDGNVFATPLSVGDAGAHRVQINDKIVVEVVRFPTHVHRGEGVIVEVLGPRGKPGVDTLMILREFDLPGEFSEPVLEDARRQAEVFDETIPSGRLDLTSETTITIDPIDARDFDDAISLVQLENHHWRLGVHIADVSHFVRPKSPLDREARERATSTYLPDQVIPMLPEIISNALASLQPGKVRYTKTVFIEYTAEGVPVAVDLHCSAIRSAKRLAYEEVDAFIADPDSWRKKLGPAVFDLLGRMRELARILRGRRFKRGALELSIPEVKVDLDKQGQVSGAHVAENTESHQIIEEFMLAANEAVAETLRDCGFLFLRRVHKPPAYQRLRALNEFVAELGLPADIPHDNLESRFALQQLLGDVVGRPEQAAVHYAVLRSMQRALYKPDDEGHYALASDCYCHFTSPIRRYPDLTVHRLVDAVLAHAKPRNDMNELIVLGEHCSEREHRAEMAERELTKLKLLTYLSERIGEEMDGLITGVESFGVFVQGVKLPADGLIHVDSLADDNYRYDRAAHTLAGSCEGNAFRLGDLVRVAIARVDIDRRELDFRLVQREGHIGRDGRTARPAVRRDAGTEDRGGGKKRSRETGQRGRVKPSAKRSPPKRRKRQ